MNKKVLATQMKQLFTLLIICLTTTLYSQRFREIDAFYNVKNDNDSTYHFFMSYLNKFDSTDANKNFFCEKSAERVGDYYKLKKDYVNAIAYYDSADTKYRDRLQFCGNAYYIDFIPRRYKVAQCYSALQNPRKALSVLTPHIFDNLGSEYFDRTMTEYYVTTLKSLYTKEQIRKELKSSVDNISYTTYYSYSLDSTVKYINVDCKLEIFGSRLVLANFFTSLENNQIPSRVSKEHMISEFKSLPIYRRLED